MSVYQSLLSPSVTKTAPRTIPTGFLLLDKMLGGIPLGGITVLLGQNKDAVVSFMRSVTHSAVNTMPHKYMGVADFAVKCSGSTFWNLNAKTFPAFIREIKSLAEDEANIFCLSAHAASIDIHVPSAGEIRGIQRLYNTKTGNGVVMYLDAEAGVPRAFIDMLTMHASIVLKFTSYDEEREQQNTVESAIPTGVRITAIKRQLSSSPIRTALFPFINGGLSDAMSVFYYLMGRGEIHVCGSGETVDGQTETYFCGDGFGLTKFTKAEWRESFADMRPLLLKNLC